MQGQNAGGAAAQGSAPTGDALASAHDRLLRDPGLQFDRVEFVPPEPPTWLDPIAAFLQAIGPLLQWVFWGVVILVAGVILFFIGRELMKLRAPGARPSKPKAAPEPEWRPDAQTARDLLAAADSLAAEGRHAEAVHLILLHSVEDIRKRKPRALKDSLTTREIAGLEALPDAGRPAFARIGGVVERSLFGTAPVDADDFADCRRAYEAFALPEAWRA